jgi:hypothetical protein
LFDVVVLLALIGVAIWAAACLWCIRELVGPVVVTHDAG